MLFDIVGKRYIFFAVSLAILVPGLLALIFWGVRPSIDFTGGTVWEVVPAQGATTQRFDQALETAGYADAVVQNAEVSGGGVTTQTVVMRLRDVSEDERRDLSVLLVEQNLVAGRVITDEVASAPPVTNTGTITGTGTATDTGTVTGTTAVTDDQATAGAGTTGGTGNRNVRAEFAPGAELQFNSVGPAVGREVQEKAMLAVLAASLGILAYLWWAFRRVPNPLRYGVCAVAALLHDALLVLGIFAILGQLFGIEVDALFITAILTVIGFSVHDTIVVFDRIRENMLRRRFDTFDKVVNYSLLQTLARSIITSLTTIFTLTALFLFGGVTIRNFVLALLIGIITGTYSSIFNASLLLVLWENREWRNWFGRGRTESGASARTA